MKIKVALENNLLPDKYGKFADEAWRYKDQPVLSFPITLTEIPEQAKFVALALVDYDAIPVCGFPWIHWTIANIPVEAEPLIIPEDFSRKTTSALQGKNSFASPFVGETDKAITERYVGPTPPDKTHAYQLTVFAFAEPVELKDGFWLNELLKEAEYKAIASAHLLIDSRAQ